MITRALNTSKDPMLRYDNYTNHMKSKEVKRENNILNHKSYKYKIQIYTRSLKTSPQPKHSLILSNSELELIYYIEKSSPNSLGVS